MKTLVGNPLKSIFTSSVIVIMFITASLSLQSCAELKNLNLPLTEGEIIEGLKEALFLGAENSVFQTNQTNGFYNNSLIKIPWPEEAAGAYNYIDNNLSVIRPLLDEVVLKMNRGAETASEKAKPIFIEAIKTMSIQDARGILQGADNAATEYLYEKTYASLHAAFKPDIHQALESVGAASAWTNITTYYNPVATFTSGISPINTDLSDYTTTKALEGLFLLIEQEELKIRNNPGARVNDILEKVFGSVDN